MNPFLQTSKKPFAATGLGVAVNTVLGLPQAALGVAKDIGQSIARSAGSTGLTLAKPLGGVEQLQPSDIKSPYAQELYKSFFGTEPLKAIEDNIAQAEIAIKNSPFAQKIGLDKVALPLAFGGIYGSDLLNLTPFGSLEKNAVKALVKETSLEGTTKILQAMRVPEDIATKFAPHFAEATTPQEVQSALDIMKGVLGVKGVETVNASKGVVPGDAKVTLANIQEKLGVKPVSEEFKVGDILDTKGGTNMVSPITVREITGNTLHFTDAKGNDFVGMQRSTVRNLVKEGAWDKVKPTEAPVAPEFAPTAPEIPVGIGSPGKGEYVPFESGKSERRRSSGFDAYFQSNYKSTAPITPKVDISPELQPLAQEARKYKSAE